MGVVVVRLGQLVCVALRTLCSRCSAVWKVVSTPSSGTVGVDGGEADDSEEEDEKVRTQLLGLLATELHAEKEVKYSLRDNSNSR